MKVCNFIILFLALLFVSTNGDYITNRTGRKIYFNSCSYGENINTMDYEELYRDYDYNYTMLYYDCAQSLQWEWGFVSFANGSCRNGIF